MSAVRTVAAGVIGLGLGMALGMVLFGGVAGPGDAGEDVDAPEPPVATAPDSPAPEEAKRPAEVERIRAPRERVGPSPEVSSLLDRAAAEIPEPEIPAGDGRIEGTVRTRAGEPVEGVEITVVMQRSPTAGERPWNERTIAEKFESMVQSERLREATTRTTVSAADGSYALDGLPDAAHSVNGRSDHYRIAHAGQFRSRVTPDAVVDLLADPIVKVPLDVTLPDGSEPDQAVISFASGNSKIGTTWTPSNRTAQIDAGTYKVTATSGEHRELTAEMSSLTLVHGETMEPVALSLSSRPGIAGRLVLAEGAAPVWAAVGAELIGADTTPESVAAGQQKASASQHEEYRFSITGLTPGRYLLVAWNQHQGGVLASREVTVGDEMAVVTLEAAPPKREDHLELTATGPDGERLTAVQVQLRFQGKRRSASSGASAVARPDGLYWVKQMGAAQTRGESGTHYVSVTHPSYGTREVEYLPGPTARAEVRFESAGFIDVTVVGAPPELLSAGLTVSGSVANGRIAVGGAGDVDAEGRLRVGPLQPGPVKLTAMARLNRRNIVLAAHDVTVRSGDNEARIVLPSLHTVRVECADPAPLVGQSVRLRRQDGDTGNNVRTSLYQNLPESGKLVFRFVPQGRYEIRLARERREIHVPGDELVRF